ncbi:MAG: LamG-like jellyroll fold domain-containing protein [Rhodothermales bacterium]
MNAIRALATRCLILAALLLASPAFGQLSVDQSADPLDAGQRVNAFVQWGGAEPVEGVQIEVPAGWSVRSVEAIRSGTTAPVSLDVAGEVGEVEATASQPLRGVQTFVVGLTAGPSLGYHTVRIAPILAGRAQPSGTEEWQVYVREAMSASRNRAFQLESGAPPVAIRRRALPSLDPRDALTLEMWLKTVGLGEVVLSTWDGNEDRPYPVEVVVDGRGRLVFYRGRPGQHEAMASKDPVADGRWHHVAVVNDPFAGWARLFVDGLPVDSLRSEEVTGMLNTMSLALGGRPERPGAAQPRLFSGQLDELRLWNAARPAVTLRRTMRVPLDAVPEGVFRLGFDEPLPPDVLVAVPATRVRVPSSLSFVFPVESLEASVEQGIVTLTWATKDRRADEFRVERSTDGQRFEAVGTVRAAERVGETADGSARFAYTDLPPDGQVLYYRIRQSAMGVAERVSGTLKLGLGEGEGSAVAIVGNSPNPFRGSTVVTYDLAKPAPVRLSVWDISGTRVAVLLDETMPAGRHEYRFAADGLPSGVYFVRLETPEGSAAHKMTLTR